VTPATDCHVIIVIALLSLKTPDDWVLGFIIAKS